MNICGNITDTTDRFFILIWTSSPNIFEWFNHYSLSHLSLQPPKRESWKPSFFYWDSQNTKPSTLEEILNFVNSFFLQLLRSFCFFYLFVFLWSLVYNVTQSYQYSNSINPLVFIYIHTKNEEPCCAVQNIITFFIQFERWIYLLFFWFLAEGRVST